MASSTTRGMITKNRFEKDNIEVILEDDGKTRVYVEKNLILESSATRSDMASLKRALDGFTARTQVSFCLIIGNAFWFFKQWEKAIEIYLYTLTIDENNIEAWSGLGAAYRDMDNEPAAINAYRKVIRLVNGAGHRNYFDIQGAIETLYDISYELHELGDPSSAILGYLDALQLDPNRTDIWEKLGDIYLEVDRLDDALHSFNQIRFRTQGRSVMGWTRLGVVYRLLGNREEAFTAHRKALERDPEYAEAWIEYGVTQAYEGDLDRAIESFDTAIKMGRKALALNLARAWYKVSRSYTWIGKNAKKISPVRRKKCIQEAINAARQAILIDPKDAEYYLNLGELLEATGDVDSAVIEYQKALENDMNERTAIKYLKRLGRPLHQSRD